MRAAALGTPVVPPVWISRATSFMEEGHCPSQGVAARIARDQERAQAGRGLASCSRLSRAAFRGSLSAILEAVGSAVVRSIEKVV